MRRAIVKCKILLVRLGLLGSPSWLPHQIAGPACPNQLRGQPVPSSAPCRAGTRGSALVRKLVIPPASPPATEPMGFSGRTTRLVVAG